MMTCPADGCEPLSVVGILVSLVAVAAVLAATLLEFRTTYTTHVELQPTFHADPMLFFGDKDAERSRRNSRRGCVSCTVTS